MRGPEGAPSFSPVSVGETKYFGNIEVFSKQLEKKVKPATGTVARAEGAHAFIAVKKGIEVEMATINSGPGFLGAVRVATPDPDVAAAHLGTGDSHNRRVIRALRANENASHRNAQRILASDPDGYDAVTSLLEEERTVTGHRIREAMDEAKKRKETVLVTIITQDGKVHETKEQSIKGIVVFDAKLIKGDPELAAFN